MGYREARELARIRNELRERLMTCRHQGADLILARLRAAADHLAAVAPELDGEYERWRLRFDMLAHGT
ncbi:MAG TPA: hypothetical protein VK698_29730 [Kofleriaceae bacterium]|nr:hypothetical protein [Kofleriaceae bacterium]